MTVLKYKYRVESKLFNVGLELARSILNAKWVPLDLGGVDSKNVGHNLVHDSI